MEFIPISQPSISLKEIESVTDAVRSGWVSSLGSYINIFEEEFARYCGTKYAITTTNGTAALHLVLASLNLTSKDEVIVPEITFIATASAVIYTGAKVVPVDIESDTLCMDPKSVESAITKNTKVILPVHLYGHPANMKEINRIARKHNLIVIEDAAEAHGAEVGGERTGSLGHAGIFSFYGNKIITTGEGGMITTSDKTLSKRIRFLRDHAMSLSKRYWHPEIGYNYRMTNLQAAMGVAQLNRIDDIIEKKRKIFFWYSEELKSIEQIKLNHQARWAKSVYWMICVNISGFKETDRDKLILKLRERNIDSRPYFYPLSSFPFIEDVKNPVAYNIYYSGLALPSYFDLTQAQVIYICRELKKLI